MAYHFKEPSPKEGFFFIGSEKTPVFRQVMKPIIKAACPQRAHAYETPCCPPLPFKGSLYRAFAHESPLCGYTPRAGFFICKTP
jgi:hypothetical protein